MRHLWPRTRSIWPRPHSSVASLTSLLDGRFAHCNVCEQAVDGGVEPVTSCVHFYGASYDRETFKVLERVKKDDGTVSDCQSRLQFPSVSLLTDDFTYCEQESPAVADKPARRESLPKIAPIRCAYNVVADNTGLSSCV